jgi:hypothetical protein
MSKKAPTLYDAMAAFLAPLEAEYCRLIDECAADLPVTISLGGYKHKTTLKVIKDMSRAHHAAFEAKLTRQERKARGTLL